MAKFAQIINNRVKRVILVDDNDCKDENGVESEATGIAFCKSIFGEDTVWLQTSFNTHHGKHTRNKTPLRKNFASAGMEYNPEKDFFIRPKPFPSWTFNEETADWDPPVPRPGEEYGWDEDNQQWVVPSINSGFTPTEPYPGPPGHYYWDDEGKKWVLTPGSLDWNFPET